MQCSYVPVTKARESDRAHTDLGKRNIKLYSLQEARGRPPKQCTISLPFTIQCDSHYLKQIMRFDNCMGSIVLPWNSFVEILNLGTAECHYVWKQGLSKGN